MSLLRGDKSYGGGEREEEVVREKRWGKVVIRVRKEGNEGLERVCQEFTEALLQVKGGSFTGLRHEQRVRK